MFNFSKYSDGVAINRTMYPHCIEIVYNGKKDYFVCRDLYGVADAIGRLVYKYQGRIGKNWDNWVKITHEDQFGRLNYVYQSNHIEYEQMCRDKWYASRK